MLALISTEVELFRYRSRNKSPNWLKLPKLSTALLLFQMRNSILPLRKDSSEVLVVKDLKFQRRIYKTWNINQRESAERRCNRFYRKTHRPLFHITLYPKYAIKILFQLFSDIILLYGTMEQSNRSYEKRTEIWSFLNVSVPVTNLICLKVYTVCLF